MSAPVSATNCWKSSTVTAFDDMLKVPMATQCSGVSNAVAPLSARSDPCLNRPRGNTTMAGQVGQSRITVPGSGTAAAAAIGASLGADACCAKNQAATAIRSEEHTSE